MRRRDISLTIALCASLGAHAMITYAFSERYVASATNTKLPPLQRAESVELATEIPLAPISQEIPFGASDGNGKANDYSEGLETLVAPKADLEQAFLSHDPAGNASPMTPAASGSPTDTSPQRSLPFGISPTELDGSLVVGIENPQRAQQSDGVPASVATSTGAPGDPAPMADTDSDAFSVEGGLEFRPGRTEARFGRKYKAVRPRVDLATRADIAYSRNVTVVLHFQLDAMGNVARVSVKKSSGSGNLDQAVKIAAYQWWFEPRPGKDSEEFDLAIRFL